MAEKIREYPRNTTLYETHETSGISCSDCHSTRPTLWACSKPMIHLLTTYIRAEANVLDQSISFIFSKFLMLSIN